MSGSQERDLIIKRGYLSEKGGLFEKRRWFVLKREAKEYRLDIYKDEKAASKGEPTKGCIKMEQVVEVQRTNDKKQTFEILCPGTGHKFMANSEAEADDWVNVLHKLKSYRKERLHPDPIGNLNQLQYYPNAEHPNVIVSPLHSIHGISDLPPHSPSHMQGVTSSAADHQFMHSPHRHMQTRPGEIQIASQPIMMTTTCSDNAVRRQDSTGAYPSPSTTSSDSSPDLVGSASTGSFDQSPATEEPSDFNKVRFRISLKGSEKLQMVGPCDLVVSEDSIVLYSINSEQQLVSWPISSLRRYGLNQVCFSIDAGRGCYTGEGTFFFYTGQSKAIYNRVHRVAQQFKRPQQQLAIEGTSSQPLPSPKTTSAYGHETPTVTSSASSVYQTLHYDYKEPPVCADHRQAHACMRASTQQQQHHQHSTGNFFVCPPQTNPISIPTSVIPTQHIMIHSPTTLHSPTTTMCPNCSLGFQQATPPSAVHFQRRPSSEEPHLSVPGMYYCNVPDPGKKRYQNVTGSPNQ